MHAMTNPILQNVPEVIETERLLIRCPRPGDGAIVYEAVVETLAELRVWNALPLAMEEPTIDASEIDCRGCHAAFMSRKNLPWLLFLKEGNVFVGGSSLHSIDWDVPKCEIGYWCRKSQQHRGLITEAVKAITSFAVSELKVRRIGCCSDEQNVPSRRVAERAGYQLEGIRRHDRVAPDGELRNSCIYAYVP
jgi:RimJ/RimL family protein N-acetyltransferase